MSKHKKIAVDHANDRQPNVSPTEMNKTEPNLDQQETNVKRLLGDDYEQFIASKFSWSKNVGIDAALETLPAGLFPFQRDVVRWALARGRAALFEDCGMGKSPFAGIGSEGYVALKEKRRFVGVELKPAYYKQAQLNLERATVESDGQMGLFAPTKAGAS